MVSLVKIAPLAVLARTGHAARIVHNKQKAHRGNMPADTFAGETYTTMEGCTCLDDSPCWARSGEGSQCDTCYTKDGCGRWALGGRWDYCDYRPSTVESWNSQSFQSKTDYYWERITANTTRYPEFPLLSNVFSSVITSFDNFRPEMPARREKLIHTVGSICKFDLQISSSSPYTGLLAPGLQTGFIRLGSAAEPGSDGLTPGLGLKLPRNGVPDGSFVMLNDLGSSGSWNFFLKNMSNHLAPASGFLAILAKKFEEASQCPYQVGLSDLAKYSQDGTQHTPRFPFKLMMIANPAIKTGANGENLDAVHAEMDALPVGTTLYSVYACAEAAGDEMTKPGDLSSCGKPLLLGDLTTSSQCTTSWYGDASFHIRHQRIEEDWQLEPDYMRQGSYDVNQACGKAVTADGAPAKCGTSGMLNDDA